MNQITIEQVLELVEQLSEAEQRELIERLETHYPKMQRPSLTLQVFEVEEWHDHWTLRREDEYGDDAR